MSGTSPRKPERFVLWIDSVGGFLVCLREEIVIGQPGCGSEVDVPVMADVSRRHARIRRDGEGYLLEAWREVRVDGQAVRAAAPLVDGCRIELGRGVLLKFTRPNALTTTARLELLSRHHTEPRTDGVLLMADSCILGPKRHSHVVCPLWREELILYRHGGELYCRTAGELEIDGVRYSERGGPLRADSRIVCDQNSLGLEPVEERLKDV